MYTRCLIVSHHIHFLKTPSSLDTKKKKKKRDYEMHRFHGTGLVSTKTQNVSQTLYLPSKNACKFPLTNLSTGKELKNIDCVKM